MTKSKAKLKVIFTILLAVLFIAGGTMLTLAFFSDKKQDEISFTIKETTLDCTATLTTNIVPNDLIAGNEFSKELKLDFTSGVPFSYRISATSSVPTVSGIRTDLITLVSVKIKSSNQNLILGSDNKFYFATSSGLSLVPTSQSSEVLIITFKVSTLANEDFVARSTSEVTRTKITYSLEYCEENALREWSKK